MTENAPNLSIPENLKYSEDHVWVDTSVSPAVLGITDYAVEQLGDLVFVDLPEVDTDVQAGDEPVELESAKAISTLVVPVSGTIRYVNSAVADDPEVINSDPYGEGWILKIDLDEDSPELMDAEGYAEIAK
ncbi:glycine cleavage system protein GcvH [Alloscardovia macacae]|uniref:Glycine cleavage system H protein n=1 Tax=Alloscardovia macacae TaxID=1160091 RepID=A0A1Y2STH4_9BIFI|nr:glycine cleavage system protein GcvH [Alloscardovia macacae]OTA26256.1 glycine cleavage system protein H [Alloscardovia macacae]OTA28917.1 glycine cleavage system protein H [Alloscardovia macacae]OZG54563.1 glycine cleavage system protein H [Alloscardovia macacae]